MIDENLPKVPPKSGIEIDELARVNMIKGFRHIQNLIQLQAIINFIEGGQLEKYYNLDYGVKLLPEGEEAKFMPESRIIILSEGTYLDLFDDKPRARFTFAHELGHAVLHGEFLKLALAGRSPCKIYKRSSLRPFEDPEWQANRFAAAFLMPTPQITKLLREGLRIDQIATYFKVSISAAETRIKKLKTNF